MVVPNETVLETVEEIDVDSGKKPIEISLMTPKSVTLRHYLIRNTIKTYDNGDFYTGNRTDVKEHNVIKYS